VPDHDRYPAAQRGPQGVGLLVGTAEHIRQVQFRVVADHPVRRGQVGLGQAQQWVDVGVVRRHQAAVDEPGPRGRVGQRADDHELVRVGDHHPFQPPLGRRVVVVGGAPQHRRPLGDPHDPGQRAGRAGHVAHDAHPVTDDDRLAAKLPGAHGHDLPVVHHARVAATVHREDEAVDGVGVQRPGPGARARGTAGADPYVVLVVLPALARQGVTS
jgi:hypothetical protein